MTHIDNDQARALIQVAKAIGRRQAIRGYMSQYHSTDRDMVTCRCGAALPCQERERLAAYLDSIVTDTIAAPPTLTTSR